MDVFLDRIASTDKDSLLPELTSEFVLLLLESVPLDLCASAAFSHIYKESILTKPEDT